MLTDLETHDSSLMFFRVESGMILDVVVVVAAAVVF